MRKKRKVHRYDVKFNIITPMIFNYILIGFNRLVQTVLNYRSIQTIDEIIIL